MVTRWSLARCVVLRRACALRRACVGAAVMSAVRVWGCRRSSNGVRCCSQVRVPALWKRRWWSRRRMLVGEGCRRGVRCCVAVGCVYE